MTEDGGHLCTWRAQPPASSNAFRLKWETGSTAFLRALLLSFMTPKLEKVFLWFNMNPPCGHSRFPSSVLSSARERKYSCIDFIKSPLNGTARRELLKPLHFYLLLLKMRKQKGKVTQLVCGWTESFPHLPLHFSNPLVTETSPQPAAPSTPTSAKGKSFTSPLWEQSANFPTWFILRPKHVYL